MKTFGRDSIAMADWETFIIFNKRTYIIETRKATLASLLRHSLPGLRLNEHFEHSGEVVYGHAGKMGLEGIVSKRLGSRYRSGRSPDWLKMKNPEASAVKREAEEDWGEDRRR
jgi:ATP-dependent DNA ligase